jgi:hypothetical protein
MERYDIVWSHSIRLQTIATRALKVSRIGHAKTAIFKDALNASTQNRNVGAQREPKAW